ncbi:hypothetical protein Tco_1238194 [Tanacetum coccineum]
MYLNLSNHQLPQKLQPENGNAPIVTKTIDGKETVIPPTSVEEKQPKQGKSRRSLEMHGEVIPQEDINQKFLRSLPQEWTMYTIVWRNKLRLRHRFGYLMQQPDSYESEVKGTSSSTINSHNVAFLSSSNTNSATRVVNTAQGLILLALWVLADNSTKLWNIAMLTIRARRFLKNTRKEAGHGQQRKNWVLTSPSWIVINCHKERTLWQGCKGTQESRYRNREPTRRTVPDKETTFQTP